MPTHKLEAEAELQTKAKNQIKPQTDINVERLKPHETGEPVPKNTKGISSKPKRVAPPIQPAVHWTRLTSCPMPWEEEAAGEPDAIGTPKHIPLRPEAVTWGLGYHFPQGMLLATLGDGTGTSTNGDTTVNADVNASGESGAANKNSATELHGNSHPQTPQAGDMAVPEEKGEMARNSTMIEGLRQKGDTWQIERVTRGVCRPDADAAGHLLTCPHLEVTGLMNLEVQYGLMSKVVRENNVEKGAWDNGDNDDNEDQSDEEAGLGDGPEAEQDDNEHAAAAAEKRSFWARLRNMLNLKRFTMKKQVQI